MRNPVDDLLAAAAQLKRNVEDLTRKIEALRPSDSGIPARDAALTKEQIQLVSTRAVALYERQEPRPVHLTITQAATMLHLSRRTVSKMVKSGELRFNRCGRIPIEQIDMVMERSRKQ